MALRGEILQHRSYYTKLTLVSALCGAAMEFFMIRTGFYEKVAMIEAERIAGAKEGNTWQADLLKLKEESNKTP